MEAIISAVLLCSGYVISAYLYNYRELSTHWRQRNQLEQTREIYDIINNTIYRTNATRIIVFGTHNGAGEPSILKPFKVSALYGTNLKEDTKRNYQNIVMDEYYINILLELKSSGKYKFRTDEQPLSLLRYFYEQEYIKLSNLYYLLSTKQGMIYISFASDTVSSWSVEDEIEFNLAVSKLKVIYEQEIYSYGILSKLARFLKR